MIKTTLLHQIERGVVQTGRSTTGTVEYTGGAGADTFIMTNLGDTLVGGKGSDTLDLNYAAILGGINVNLASATNQIVSANGSAISGSVTGFENVDLSGYTGTFGALITSGSNVLLGTTAALTGTANADQIVGASGADTITGGAGADTLTGNGGADIFTVTTGDTGITAATADTITDFATGSDTIGAYLTGAAEAVEADGGALANFTALVAAADAVFAAGVGSNDGIYISFNAMTTGDAYVLIDEDDSGSFDSGDTLLILTGINLAAEIAPADFV